MDLDFAKVRMNLCAKYSAIRSLLRILEMESFKEIRNTANNEELIELYNLLLTEDNDGVFSWLQSQKDKSNKLDGKTVKQLRRLGGQLAITGYNTIPKQTLINEIRRRQEHGLRSKDKITA